MMFRITRTSDWYGKPCEEAYLLRDDVTHDFATWVENHPVTWGTVGKNGLYRSRNPIEGSAVEYEENGYRYIRYTYENYSWYIDISTLDELLMYMKKWRYEVILTLPDKIEIYDNYRE